MNSCFGWFPLFETGDDEKNPSPSGSESCILIIGWARKTMRKNHSMEWISLLVNSNVVLVVVSNSNFSSIRVIREMCVC